MTISTRSLALAAKYAVLILLAGCGSSVDVPPEGDPTQTNNDGGTNPGTDTGTPPTTICESALTMELAAPVIEVRSKLAFAIKLTTSDPGGAGGDHPLKVVLKKDGTDIKTIAEGPEPLGAYTTSFSPSELALTPGAYTIEATLGCPSTATSSKPATTKGNLIAARLGAVKVQIGAGDGALVPLMYHAVNGINGNAFPITASTVTTSMDLVTGEPELDTAAGVARTFPDLWTELYSPKVDSSGGVIEDGVSYPVSLKVGTKPDVTFTIGKTAKGGPAIPAGAPPIRLVLEGATPGDEPMSDKVVTRFDKSPVEKVGKYDLTLKWHFEAKDTTGWKAIPGATQEAPVRIYGVLGNDIGTAAPNLPWVAVVEAATKKINGATNDPAEIRKILVELIYAELALKYDRRNGASFYTSYTSGFTGARFSLNSFLKRSAGSTVNCTDCASILSTYSNMVGAPLKYAIIQGAPGTTGFSLNPIMGIGSTTFGSPFDSGRMGFSYHAVTSNDAAKTINDATLALDGDSDPKVAPQTKLLVQNIPGTEYLTRLSPGAPEYRYVDQTTTVR
jgi:hypothetical protein